MPADIAPGDLEVVRSFLNTYAVPNDTRTPTDALPTLGADPTAWSEVLPGIPRPVPEDLDALRALRSDLREALGAQRPTSLAAWLERIPLAPVLRDSADRRPVELVDPSGTAAGALLASALDAVSEGTWHRLRGCPDCRYVFYDTSRNASRTWCRMTKEDAAGRSCGSLAKARAKRERDRAAATGG